ncbi:hypothetical protein ACI3QN_13120, partial [Propionibacterium freudenreichii]
SLTSTDQPLRTQTTSFTRSLLVPPHEEGLLMPYYGASKSAVPTSEAMGTLTTVDRYALVTGPQPRIEDCGFRMLEPSEYARGMG